MIAQMALSPILGIPMIAWGGMVTFLCFAFGAYIGYQNRKGNMSIAPTWHFRMAYIGLGLGVFHGVIGMLALLGF